MKVHPIISVAVGGGDDQRASKDQQLFAPAVDAFAPCNGSGGVVEQVESTKKAARKRPSMLVIPVVPEAGEAPAGWGVVVAEKEAEVEVEGERFCLASRRGARHAMEDAYCAITHNVGAESQLVNFLSSNFLLGLDDHLLFLARKYIYTKSNLIQRVSSFGRTISLLKVF
jgi:protein phosphatase 1L